MNDEKNEMIKINLISKIFVNIQKKIFFITIIHINKVLIFSCDILNIIFIVPNL